MRPWCRRSPCVVPTRRTRGSRRRSGGHGLSRRRSSFHLIGYWSNRGWRGREPMCSAPLGRRSARCAMRCWRSCPGRGRPSSLTGRGPPEGAAGWLRNLNRSLELLWVCLGKCIGRWLVCFEVGASGCPWNWRSIVTGCGDDAAVLGGSLAVDVGWWGAVGDTDKRLSVRSSFVLGWVPPRAELASRHVTLTFTNMPPERCGETLWEP